MLFFIDCEFDVPTQTLISLGIVSEDGVHVFYEVVEYGDIQDPWVKANVIPILEKKPIPMVEFQNRLETFVKQFPGMSIISDHPNDTIYFSKALLKEKGEWIMIQPLTFQVDDALSAKVSTLLHNAVHDAHALRKDWLRLYG